MLAPDYSRCGVGVGYCSFSGCFPPCGLGVGSGVGLGVGSGVGFGVGSGLGFGVGSGPFRLSYDVGCGEGSGVGCGEGSGVGCGEGSGVGCGVDIFLSFH
jgi:hypothetical protein